MLPENTSYLIELRAKIPLYSHPKYPIYLGQTSLTSKTAINSSQTLFLPIQLTLWLLIKTKNFNNTKIINISEIFLRVNQIRWSRYKFKRHLGLLNKALISSLFQCKVSIKTTLIDFSIAKNKITSKKIKEPNVNVKKGIIKQR